MRRRRTSANAAVGAIFRWERVRRYVDPLVIDALELNDLVCGSIAHHASVGVAGDHAEAFEKSPNDVKV